MNNTKLSGVVITFNEEAKIERCLNSLWHVCDEVVVLDSFSTDATCDIARRLNCKVVQHAFDGHIQQKNRAITLASNPFIISLDADEELSTELIESIIKVKADKQFDGYVMNRLNNYGGQWIRHGAWYPDRKLRLWDSTKGYWGGENPHDKFIMMDGSKIGSLRGNLLHYTMNGLSDLISQTNKFSDIAATAMFLKNKKIGGIQKIFKVVFRFVKEYVFLLGFLDGKAGFDIARTNAHYVWLKYTRLNALHKKTEKK